MNKLFCSWCGSQISESMSNCPSCGAGTDGAYYLDRHENTSYSKTNNVTIKTKSTNVFLNKLLNWADIRFIDKKDSYVFDVSPRDLFLTLKNKGNNLYSSEIYKNYKGQVGVVPELYELSENNFYIAISSMIASLSSQNASLNFSGYTQSGFMSLSQRVSAWNGGHNTIVIGTKLALMKIISLSDNNYRYNLDDTFYYSSLMGTSTFAVQSTSSSSYTQLSDSKLYFICPTNNKLFKIVSENENFEKIGFSLGFYSIYGIMNI